MNVYLNMTLMWTSGTLITAFSPLVPCFSNCNYLGSVLSLLSLMKPLYSWLLLSKSFHRQKNETVVELNFFFSFFSPGSYSHITWYSASQNIYFVYCICVSIFSITGEVIPYQLIPHQVCPHQHLLLYMLGILFCTITFHGRYFYCYSSFLTSSLNLMAISTCPFPHDIPWSRTSF